MNSERICTFLGFAHKSGSLLRGGSIINAIRSGEAYAVLYDAAASENTKKRYKDACGFHKIPVFEMPEGSIEHSIGRINCMTAAITDDGIARQIIEAAQ